MMQTRMVTVLVAIALVIGGMTSLPRLFAQPSARKPVNITLKTVDGKTLKLADYRGKVVMIDVWATWCPSCRAEIPEIVKLQSELTRTKQDVVIIALSVDDDKSVLPGFITDNKINYPIATRNDKAVNALGSVEYIPTKFFIDRNGIIRDSVVGGMTTEEFQQKLATYLKEKADTK